MNTKHIALAATLLLASAGAQAAQFTPVGDWNKQGSQVKGYPAYLDESESCAQNLLTADVLSKIAVSYDNAKGTATKAAIKSITFNVAFIGFVFWPEEGIDFEVVAENTDATSFPIKNSKYQFLPYGSEGSVTTTYTFDSSYDDPTYNLDWDWGYSNDNFDAPITITFDPPLVYDGESLLLTWKVKSNMLSEQTESWWEGGYTGETSYVATLCNKNLTPTGPAAENATALPLLLFDYDTFEEELGGGSEEETIIEGDPTTFLIGDPTAEPSNSSAGYALPLSIDVAVSSAQTIYSPEELVGLCSVDGSQKAKITDITVFFPIEAMPYDVTSFDFTIYVQNYDGTTFPVVSGKPQWIEYTTDHKGTATVNESNYDEWDEIFLWGFGGPLTVKIHLDEPIVYEGKSLLITWLSESDFNEDGFHASSYEIKTSEIRSANQYNTTKMSGTIVHSYKFLPSVEFDYIPLTVQGGTKPNIVSFEKVTLGFGTATDGKNYVKADFDLADDANCGSYTIKVGSKEIGTINEKHGTIAYINPNTKLDLLINVIPDDKNSVGQSYTITPADIAAIFTAPVVKSTLATAMSGTISLDNNASHQVNMSRAFLLDVEVPTAPFAEFSSGNDNIQILTDNSGFNGLPVTGNVVAANNGLVSLIVKNSQFQIQVLNGEYSDKSESLSFTPTFKYLVYYASDFPTLGTTPANINYDRKEAKAETYRVTFDTKTSDMNLSFTYAPEDNGKIQFVQKKDYLFFFFPAEHKLHYASFVLDDVMGKAPAAAPMFRANNLEASDVQYPGVEYKEVQTPALVLSVDEHKGKEIHLYTLDDNGKVQYEENVGVSDQGAITGVADVVVGQDTEIEFYNLQGIKVDASALTPGVYVARQGATATKVVVR